MNKKHDNFLEALKTEWLNKEYPSHIFKVNELYDPINRQPKDNRKKGDYQIFEYDILRYPQDSGGKWDWTTPEIFVEFTTSKQFQISKFLYEFWRWLVFLRNIEYLELIPLPPYESLIERDVLHNWERKRDPFWRGRNWKATWQPKLIQIWKAKNIEENYKRLKKDGYVPDILEIECYSSGNDYSSRGGPNLKALSEKFLR